MAHHHHSFKKKINENFSFLSFIVKYLSVNLSLVFTIFFVVVVASFFLSLSRNKIRKKERNFVKCYLLESHFTLFFSFSRSSNSNSLSLALTHISHTVIKIRRNISLLQSDWLKKNLPFSFFLSLFLFLFIYFIVYRERNIA